MADVDTIENMKQLETWLKTQDVRISRAIAARASLRSLPTLMAIMDQTSEGVLGGTALLSGLRAAHISCGASCCQNPDTATISKAAQSSAFMAAYSVSDKLFHPAASARSSARAAANAAAARSVAHSAAALSASSAIHRAAEAHPINPLLSQTASSIARNNEMAIYSAAFQDVRNVRRNLKNVLFDYKLWSDSDTIAPLLKMWADFEARPDPAGIWSYWRDWYRSMLQGKPMDWDLQLQVALIDNAIWEAGPEAVAQEIERIRAKFELEKEVSALKEQLSDQQQALARNPQIGDNGGPPMDGANAEAFKKDLVLLWSDIEELETELEKPEPSPSVLKRIAQSLSETAQRVAAYCGATMDVSVKAAAKAFGATLGPIGATEIVKPGSIEAVAKAIGKLLSALAN